MNVEAHDWQRDHINKLCFAINRFNVGVDASDMGTGKTIMALLTAKELGLYPVVVCPKSVISTWKRWIKDILGDIELCSSLNRQGCPICNCDIIIECHIA